MADVLVTEHDDTTTVSVRAGKKTWLMATPFLLLFCSVSCLIIGSLFGVLHRKYVGSAGHFFDIILLVLALQQLFLTLSRLRARSTLTLQRNTIHIVTGGLLRQEDRGTYNANILSVPHYEHVGALGPFPQGKVETRVGTVALVLASQIDKAGGARLLAALTRTLVYSSGVPGTLSRV